MGDEAVAFMEAHRDEVRAVFESVGTRVAEEDPHAAQVLDLGRHLLERDRVVVPGLEPGPYVELTVKDTGHGMSSETLERVFEPSFTTKTSGTGLGMPIVKRIVDDHAGTIALRSTPGLGTRVTVLLPYEAPS